MTTWRYQPVYVEETVSAPEPHVERTMSLCEVYLDESGRLTGWTENRAMAPQGETVDELVGDLTRMLSDANRWEPVPYDALEVGMTFERRLDAEF